MEEEELMMVIQHSAQLEVLKVRRISKKKKEKRKKKEFSLLKNFFF